MTPLAKKKKPEVGMKSHRSAALENARETLRAAALENDDKRRKFLFFFFFFRSAVNGLKTRSLV